MTFVVGVTALLAAAVSLAGWLLSRPVPRDPAAQAALERCVAMVDRELAANLEMTSMFDQTHQAVILEMAEFERARTVLAKEAADIYPAVESLYARVPEAESAMERRGPAGSLKDADRLIVEAWEGDARVARRSLRAALVRAPRKRWRVLRDRLGRGS